VPATVAVAALGLLLTACTGDGVDERAVESAARSVERDADRLADVLERRCTRVRTCPRAEASQLAEALSRPLSEGNEVTFYRGEQFDVVLCVANEEHDVWAYYHSEYGTETFREGEPCVFA
jgi:hypothetical protein